MTPHEKNQRPQKINPVFFSPHLILQMIPFDQRSRQSGRRRRRHRSYIHVT